MFCADGYVLKNRQRNSGQLIHQFFLDFHIPNTYTDLKFPYGCCEFSTDRLISVVEIGYSFALSTLKALNSNRVDRTDNTELSGAGAFTYKAGESGRGRFPECQFASRPINLL